METLKVVLYKMGVPFTVAPYSALAQVGFHLENSNDLLILI